MGYRAFVSYSQAADGKLAPALQSALQRIAKPWYRLRGMRVFRDETTLSVTPAMWGSIQKALDDSEYFILLASPEAARSKWVQQEVDHWLTNRSADRLLIVLTAGELHWNDGTSDFDWSRTDALPRRMGGAFRSEPFYLDLRWAKGATDLSLWNSRFLEATSRLAATLRSIPLDELIGQDVRQHEKTRRLVWASVVVLTAVTVASAFAAISAFQARSATDKIQTESRQIAEQARLDKESIEREARSRKLARAALQEVTTDRELAMLLAAKAVSLEANPEAKSALRRALSGPLRPGAEFQAHQGSIRSVELSRDGKRVLTAGSDGAARIWDAAGGPPLVEFANDQGSIDSARYGPEEAVVVTTGEDGAVRLWDASSRNTVQTWKGLGAVLSEDRISLFIVQEGKVLVRDTRSGAAVAEFEEDFVSDLAISPDRRLVAIARLAVGPARNGVLIRKLPGGQEFRTLPQNALLSMDFSPDGQRLFTSGTDNSATVWDISTGRIVLQFKGGGGSIRDRFTLDGARILIQDGGILGIWDAATGKKLGDTDRSPDENPMSILLFAVNQSGEWMVTEDSDADRDGGARIWEIAGPVEIGELVGDPSVRSASFSADGLRVVTGSLDGKVRVYSCEACGSSGDLLRLAAERAKRALTPEEHARYGADPPAH